MRVSMSKDHGRTWSAPRNWSGSASTASSPWVGFRDDRNVDVLWYQGLAAPVTLVLSRGPADGYPTQRAVVAVVQPMGGRSAGNTDYAHFARLRDGRVIAVWCESSVFASVEARAR